MAEDTLSDPRDVAHHPRRRLTLYGHEEAENHLLRAVQAGKLHHAWLISGNEGIGKATLAYRFARFLLSGGGPQAAALAVSPDRPASRQIAAGAHPDLFVLERAVDTKNKDKKYHKLKTVISVDDARDAIQFFSRTAGAGGWRIGIVDEAGDLNKESANALLKIIEEPPEKAVFLILAHRLGTVLPTIRSRCIHLPLKPLSTADTVKVLREVSPGAEGPLAEAAELSRGSPGLAMQLIGSRGAKAFAAFLGQKQLSPTACIELGMHFAHRDNAADFAIFTDLLTGWIAAEARRRGLAGAGEKLARAHGDIVYSIRQTDALNLDRRQTVVDALLLLDEALKAS
jgi:DNA polymerase III subunit delta'